ncbi:hypothetical protein [Streptomyces cavernicola]|uniref:PE-PGRS family protein n=1 Tax=Streptomyces cavernicola TaxID=3043613 RepID=A0ABT6S6F2_9ACTN|nr:hypothetical protein [Streptomyces sp. B-S-A6]MDI3403612.1 hypothetical protein [Streptomyces sp. B-S-A6]
MTTIRRTYPLVEERVLAPAPRTGRRFWNRPTRADDELPRVAAHQVLVYRTGDQYLTDHGVRGPADEAVLNAGSVTVVDCRTEVPVTVGTDVPSAETDGFTVQVAFPCTVTDPVAVVREGVTDVESRLLGYLRALPGLTEVTQEWPLDQGKQVSRRLTARLISYLEMQPPRIAGLAVGTPYLTVLTPEEFAAQQRRADEERREAEQDRVKEAVRRERERMEHERKALELQHEQELEELKRRYAQRTDAEDQHYSHDLKRKENEFSRTEALKDLDDFGTDADNADILARSRGEISYTELSDRQREADRVRRERQREDEERHWEYAERRRQAEREEIRYSLERDDRHQEIDRQDRRAALEAEREEKRERRAEERQDRLRRRADQREDELADREERRHRADRRDSVNQELGRQMINRGLLDNAPLDARAFVERLSSGQGLIDEEPRTVARQVTDAESPQLEEGEGRSYEKEQEAETAEEHGREHTAPSARRPADPRGGEQHDERVGDGYDDAGRAADDGAADRLIADDDLGEAGREERGR